MKTRILILLHLVIIIGQAFSQEMQFEWSKTIGTSGNNIGKNIINDDKGFLYVAGEFKEDFILDDSTISGFGINNIFIMKLDLDGNLIWAESLGSNNLTSLGQICFDKNMNIVCTGTYAGSLLFKDTIINSKGGTDIFVAKIRNTGEILNVISDGGVGNEKSNSLCIDDNNNIYVCGSFSGEADFGNYSLTSSGEWRYSQWSDSVYVYIQNSFFAKYNSQNNCVFAKQICRNLSDLYSIVSDDDNNIYTTGYFNSYNDLTDTIVSEIGNFLVFKFDQGGNLINLIQEGSSNNFIKGNALAIDNDNNLLIAGYIGCSGCIFGDSLLPASYNDAFLVKYDPFGNMKWIHLIGQYNGDNDGNENSGNSIVVDKQNNIILTGYFDGIDFNGVIITGNNSSIDFLVMKFTQSGNITDIGKYGYPTWDVGEGISIDNANNIYFTGYTYKGATSTAFPSYIFIAKVDSSFPLGIEDADMSNKIKIYPNPTHGIFTIDLSADFHQKATIYISSIDGKIMYCTDIKEKREEVFFTGNKPNLYIIRIQFKDKVYYKKLLIQ